MAFIMYAKCSVEYDGRASGKLETGKYIILYKDDRSLSIHGGDKIKPRNYMWRGSTITITDDTILISSNKESLKISIYDMIWKMPIEEWSTETVKISGTERDLVNKFIADPVKYLGFKPDRLITEYKTKAGIIDIYIEYNNNVYIIEAKRNKLKIRDCAQISQYLGCFNNSIGYLMAPDASERILEHMRLHNIGFIKI